MAGETDSIMDSDSVDLTKLDLTKSGTTDISAAGAMTLDHAPTISKAVLQLITEAPIASAVVELSKEIPLFGSLVNVLSKLALQSTLVQKNKAACIRVSIWADSIKASVINAAPILLRDEATKSTFPRLLMQFICDLNALLEMSIAFSNKCHMVKLVTSARYKTKFEEAKPRANELLQALQTSMIAAMLEVCCTR